MTNREKYKDPKERAKMFCEFCSSKKGCVNCQFNKVDANPHACAYAWEELEYKEELLPCPFCGGTPTVNSTLVSTDGWEARDMVMCNTCGIQFHGQNAIDRWNRRAES